MSLPNVFNEAAVNLLVTRVNNLTADKVALWGKMNVAQMLAHCNVTYEMVYDNIHKTPNAVVRFILKALVKNKVVNEKPYTHNGSTAPQFVIKTTKNFNVEKKRLIDYILKSQKNGEAYFNNKASHSFGNLTSTEWNNMFYKHLDHHLNQFGV